MSSGLLLTSFRGRDRNGLRLGPGFIVLAVVPGLAGAGQGEAAKQRVGIDRADGIELVAAGGAATGENKGGNQIEHDARKHEEAQRARLGEGAGVAACYLGRIASVRAHHRNPGRVQVAGA